MRVQTPFFPISNQLRPPIISGRWYGPNDSILATDLTLAVDTMYGVLFGVPKKMAFDRIGFEVTALEALKNARIGIYNAPDGTPTSLVVGSAAISLGTTGDKEAVISQTLGMGWYVLALLSNATGTAQIEQFNCTFGMRMFGHATAVGNNMDAYVEAAQAYGALPANFPSLTYTNSASTPLLGLRAA